MAGGREHYCSLPPSPQPKRGKSFHRRAALSIKRKSRAVNPICGTENEPKGFGLIDCADGIGESGSIGSQKALARSGGRIRSSRGGRVRSVIGQKARARRGRGPLNNWPKGLGLKNAKYCCPIQGMFTTNAISQV